MDWVPVAKWFFVVWIINHGVPQKVYDRAVSNRSECQLLLEDIDDAPGADPPEVIFTCVKRTTKYVLQGKT